MGQIGCIPSSFRPNQIRAIAALDLVAVGTPHDVTICLARYRQWLPRNAPHLADTGRPEENVWKKSIKERVLAPDVATIDIATASMHASPQGCVSLRKWNSAWLIVNTTTYGLHRERMAADSPRSLQIRVIDVVYI
jgi:hypothetical protein